MTKQWLPATALLTLTTALMSGCASMSEEECQTADWGEVGYNDAVAGTEITRADDYREDCAKAGVKVDFPAYRRGYDTGLPRYCTLETGFNHGMQGYDTASQCDSARFPQYKLGYGGGRDVYAVDQERLQLVAERDEKSRQIDALSSEIGEKEQALQSKDIDKKTRRNYLERLRTLKSLLGDVAADKRELDQAISLKNAEISAMSAPYIGR